MEMKPSRKMLCPRMVWVAKRYPHKPQSLFQTQIPPKPSVSSPGMALQVVRHLGIHHAFYNTIPPHSLYVSVLDSTKAFLQQSRAFCNRQQNQSALDHHQPAPLQHLHLCSVSKRSFYQYKLLQQCPSSVPMLRRSLALSLPMMLLLSVGHRSGKRLAE